MRRHFTRRGRAALLLGIGLLGLPLRALSLTWETTSGLSVDLDTTLTYGAQWRVEDASASQLRRPDPGLDFAGLLAFLSQQDTVIAQNMDDGNNNFGTGLVSNRFSAVSDLELRYGNFGAFLRGRVFYDRVYQDQRTDLDAAGALTWNNRDATDFGDFTDATRREHGTKAELLDAWVYGNFSLGERALNLRAGRQVINWGETTFFPGINGMQNRFDASVANVPGTEVREILLPTGSIYAQFDLNAAVAMEAYYQYEWRSTRLNGVGSYFSQQDYLGPGAANYFVGALELFGFNPLVPRLPDDEPGDQGQWGTALRYSLDSGTELGLFYVRAHDKAPSFRRNSVALAGFELPVDYQVIYFDDIHTVAASFSTLLGNVQVNGEVSARMDAPFADADGVPRREDLLQAQLGFTQVVRPTRFWDDLTLVGEVVGVDVVDRGSAELAFDGAALSWALRAEFAYFNVLPALDVSVPVFILHTVKGTLREANMVDGAVVVSVGVRGVWRDSIVAELSYASYAGGGFDNWLLDRDNIAFNIKYSF
ncbi:MAG: DUF1302 family protein [Haliea sp.]|uniref:DUF1302 domain-containing protein n=1 Tax=Haliea sp. TaxID=1932666 RepID=UPI0032EF729B